MRIRYLAALLGALVLVAVVGLFAPADAGNGNYVVVDKVVDGPAPEGTVFEIEVDCSPLNGANANAPIDPDPVTLEFDANGAPLGADKVSANAGELCTVTETVTGGATVGYACDVPPITIDAAEPEFIAPVECVDDQTVAFQDVTGAEGTVTVTNTFAPPPAAEAAPAGVVAARPAFTG